MSRSHLSLSRCAACKCLRRRCAPDCILAPHFPSSNPQRFASVHKVFGAANTTKMLEQVPENLRKQAAETIVFEAVIRVRDPVYGSVGIISQLHQQITQVQNEIIKINGEIALRNAHQHQHKHQDQTTLHLQELDRSSDLGTSYGLHLDAMSMNGDPNFEEAGQYHEELGGHAENYWCTNFND